MRLAQIFRIQRGEGQLVALVVGLMFVASAALTIGESGIDALFFNRVGAQALPVMYLLQGTAAFLAMLALTGILGRLGPRRAGARARSGGWATEGCSTSGTRPARWTPVWTWSSRLQRWDSRRPTSASMPAR